MRRVSKEEFFDAIYHNKLDVHPTIINDRWPYISEFRYRNRPNGLNVYGRIVSQDNGENIYYIA